jgi:hypothetical protein
MAISFCTIGIYFVSTAQRISFLYQGLEFSEWLVLKVVRACHCAVVIAAHLFSSPFVQRLLTQIRDAYEKNASFVSRNRKGPIICVFGFMNKIKQLLRLHVTIL